MINRTVAELVDAPRIAGHCGRRMGTNTVRMPEGTAGLVNKEVPSGLTPCQIGALKLAEDIYQRLRRKVLAVITLQDKGKLQPWQVPAAIMVIEIYLRMDADRVSATR